MLIWGGGGSRGISVLAHELRTVEFLSVSSSGRAACWCDRWQRRRGERSMIWNVLRKVFIFSCPFLSSVRFRTSSNLAGWGEGAKPQVTAPLSTAEVTQVTGADPQTSGRGRKESGLPGAGKAWGVTGGGWLALSSPCPGTGPYLCSACFWPSVNPGAGLVWGQTCFSRKGLSYSDHPQQVPRSYTPSHPDTPFHNIFQLSTGNLTCPYFFPKGKKDSVHVQEGGGEWVTPLYAVLCLPLFPAPHWYLWLLTRHSLPLRLCHVWESSDKECQRVTSVYTPSGVWKQATGICVCVS